MDADQLSTFHDFTGQTAIVTGGTRGIGRAVAEGLAAGGADVVVASRKADACAETQAHLESMGAQALGIALNMGDADGAERLVAATVERFGGVDIVINNAANALAAPIGEQTDATWQKSFEVNLRGPALLIQAAVPHLEAAEHASVVNVISVGAFQFARGVSMYAAMKAALLSVTRSFAGELAGKGIRVNALAPGPVDTDMTRNLGEGAPEAMGAGTLLGRPAQPDEMVGPALFLAGRGASYVTGQVLVADGGMHPH
ncbi:MAG: SDR family NAD(P)-dependent oxidoreductase [Acidimicrobiales bacterium]|nr:SDR family NAD(P)-dependent oxidoreductase [Acidimicrobiales bacterium]